MEEKTSGEINKYLDFAIEKIASDIHIISGIPIVIRIDGKLFAVPGSAPATPEKIRELLDGFVPKELGEIFKNKKELDFSFGYKDMRFRVNIYMEKGVPAASLRLIPKVIRGFKELGLPPILEKFTEHNQGFVVLAGPTGSGKSTTLASIVDRINENSSKHIVTIEDPIEYVFEHKKSIISQREVGYDTESFPKALRSALREDPDVVYIGEMRDLETTEAALTIAETGHLVFTTLHTNSAAQTADRIVNIFPPHLRQQVASQLASVLLGVVSQRLIPKVGGGRVLATEILIGNSAVKSLIREEKSYQIPNVIQTSAAEGMISLDKVLAEYVSRGDITLEDALSWSLDPKSFKMMVY